MAESAAPAGGRVVHPDGSITYDFDGHIRAEGLDLPAANLPVSLPENVPTASGISWLSLAGDVIARLWADTRGVDLYADGTIMARTAAASRMVLDNAGDSDFAFASELADVVRGDPGLHISPQGAVGFGIAGGSFTDVDIDFGVPLTGNTYLPLIALLEDPTGATDRCNHPTYTESGPTTLRFRISTDWPGTVSGTIVVHLLYYA
jgi:hypothetical protein